MDLMTLTDSPNLCMYSGFLLEEESATFEISDFRQHGTLHYRTTFVVFNVPHPPSLVQGDLLCKSLLLEISYSVVVGVSQEVHDIRSGLDIVFQMRHKMSAVALDLLIRRDGAKHNLCKLASLKRLVGDSSDQLVSTSPLSLEFTRDSPNDLQWLLHDRHT